MILSCKVFRCSYCTYCTLFFSIAEPPPDVHFRPSNHSVTISWSKPETALLPAGYVVEWYPEGYKQEELRWNKLSRNDNHAVITGVTCGVTVNIGEIRPKKRKAVIKPAIHYRLVVSVTFPFFKVSVDSHIYFFS